MCPVRGLALHPGDLMSVPDLDWVRFVRSTAPYESYSDFWELVKLSGLETVQAAAVDLNQPGTLIWPTMDTEFIDRLSRQPRGARAARVVFWYLERPDERPGVDPLEMFRRAMGEILEWADVIWVSDMGLHQADPRTVFAILGGHPKLGFHNHEKVDSLEPEPRYDVAHLGVITPRRAAVLDKLRSAGLRVSGNARGAGRQDVLLSSGLLLNIDRVEGLHVLSGFRAALAAAFRIPLIHEAVRDPFPLLPFTDFVSTSYDSLVDCVLRELKATTHSNMVNSAWRTLCVRWTFRRGVEDALRCSPRLLT